MITALESEAMSAWRFPAVGLPKDPSEVAVQPRSHRAAISALAVTLGLAIGAFALYRWRRHKQREIPPSRQVSAPVWLPHTPEGFNELLLTARAFVHMTPDLEYQRRLVWAWHWRGTPYPESWHVDDHPTRQQAAELVRAMVDTARAQAPPRPSEHVPEMASSMPSPPDLSAFTSETPAPGYFYRVRAGDELLGEHGVIANVLHAAACEVARRKGWPRDKIESRARKVAVKVEAQAAYADMLREGEWNADQLEPLNEGALLWLPPLRRLSLLDRSRSRQITVDSRRWPDGSSRLEPPPPVRPRRRSNWSPRSCTGTTM